MNKLLLGLGGAGWFGLVFLGTFRLTFPAQQAALFVTDAVDEVSKGKTQVTMDGVNPWGFGISADRAMISQRQRVDGQNELVPVFFADELAVKVGPFSLISREPYITSKVVLGEGEISGSVQTFFNDKGAMKVRDLEVDIDTVDVGSFMSLIGGTGTVVDLSGPLNGSIDIDLSDGAKNASGDITLKGTEWMLSSIGIALLGGDPIELGTPIDSLEFELHGNDGVLDIDKGELRSVLADVDITGEVELAAKLERSKIRAELVVRLGDWSDTPLGSFQAIIEGALSSAKWEDGSYHYTIDTTFDRFSGRSLRPKREASSGSRAERYGAEPVEEGEVEGESREARRERRRAEREARRAAAAAGGEVTSTTRPPALPERGEPEEDLPLDEEEEELLDDTDLLEEEEFIEDEPLDDEPLEEDF